MHAATDGRTVVITGASAGVGRATAVRFGARGAKVALLARGRAGLDGAAKEVERAGGTALAIQCDVADADAVEAAATQVEDELGPIDVWINNAMVTVLSRTWDNTPEDYRRVMEVNFHGAVHGTLAALRRMRARDRGHLIQVGSALSFRGIPLQSAYCASKHALEGFTESLRTELLAEDSNVHLGIVHLPGLNTPQFTWCRTRLDKEPMPVPPVYQPEVAAQGIVWAVDDAREETWVAGSTFGTIIGNRIAPKLLGRYLGATGIESQQTDTPVDRSRHDNLFAPLDQDEDRGTHGPFDDLAHDVSPQLELAEAASRLTRIAGVGAAVIAAGAAVAGAVGAARRGA